MLCGSSISSGALLICISPFPKCKARPAGRRNRERVICSSRWGQLSVHSENGADELVFQAAFHVLVQAQMGTAAFIVNRPGAELVYVALVVPQDLLHSVSVPGAGRVAHRQRQQFPTLVAAAFHRLLTTFRSMPSIFLADRSAILFCAAGRHSGTSPEPRQSRHLLNPELGVKSKCSAPAPADWQRLRQPVRC